jgi:Tfp pilus assembly protein PilN
LSWTVTQKQPILNQASLLGVPLTLAVLGVIFQQKQQKRSEDLAKQQRDRDAEIAQQQRAQAAEETNEEVLQVYIDRLSTLLVDKNLLAIAAKEKRISEEKVARWSRLT